MKTNKLLVFSTIALLLINIVLVYFLWNSKKQRHSKKESRGERGDWVVKELNLDEKQKEEHKKIKDSHFATLKPVFDSITSTRKALYELLKDPAANDSMVNYYTDIIGKKHAQISQFTFDHFKKLRAICNPEQQLKLDTLVQKIVQNMGRKGGNGPGKK